MRKIEQYAGWLDRQWPSAAGSLREGLAEMFTINRLNLPGSLRRCLGTAVRQLVAALCLERVPDKVDAAARPD